MAGIGDFFKAGSIGEQLLVWGVLNQVFSAAVQPELVDIQSTVNSAGPVVPLSASDLAAAVARSILPAGDGAGEATKTGIDGTRFAQLVRLAQSPPALGMLLAAYQRSTLGGSDLGLAGVDFDTALLDLGINPAYNQIIKNLAVEVPTAQEVMNAWLEGQIEEPEALKRYLTAGGDPSWFQTSYNAQGQAPTPVQALDMLNRGIITEGGTGPASTSYEQAFLEGPWRNKWLPAFRALGIYLPPPRTITALLKEGAISQAEALTLLQDHGLPAALAAAYVKGGSSTAVAAAKALSEAQIVELYSDKLVTMTEAEASLVALKYSPADAKFLLEIADLKSAAAATKSAVTSIEAQYKAGKLTVTQAESALQTLGISAAQAPELVAVWALAARSSVRLLTASQYAEAFKYLIIDQSTAQAGLVALGYDAFDAWVILSNEAHGPLPDQPPGPGLAPVGG